MTIYCSRCGAESPSILAHWSEVHGGVPKARYLTEDKPLKPNPEPLGRVKAVYRARNKARYWAKKAAG